MRKRMYLFFYVLLFFSLVIATNMYFTEKSSQAIPSPQSDPPLHEDVYEVSGPKTVEVVLRQTDTNGEKHEERIRETIWSMEDFWANYADWQLIDQNETSIIFHKFETD